MPIIIRVVDHEHNEVQAVAFGPIDYAEVEKHLLEERTMKASRIKNSSMRATQSLYSP